MPTYTVLYAEDVPHYGLHEIEADSDTDAIEKARAMDADELCAITVDPDHNNTVCKRIVYIERPDGGQIGNDVALDAYHLRHGEADRLLCEAAEDLLEALKTAVDRLTIHNCTGDEQLFIEAFEEVIATAEGRRS